MIDEWRYDRRSPPASGMRAATGRGDRAHRENARSPLCRFPIRAVRPHMGRLDGGDHLADGARQRALPMRSPSGPGLLGQVERGSEVSSPWPGSPPRPPRRTVLVGEAGHILPPIGAQGPVCGDAGALRTVSPMR